MTLHLGESALSQVWKIIQASKLVSATDIRANHDLIFTECVSSQKLDLLVAVINTTMHLSLVLVTFEIFFSAIYDGSSILFKLTISLYFGGW